MANNLNIKGTIYPDVVVNGLGTVYLGFQLGTNGPTIYQGVNVPPTNNPVPFNPGDLFIQQAGSTSSLFNYIGTMANAGTWNNVTSSATNSLGSLSPTNNAFIVGAGTGFTMLQGISAGSATGTDARGALGLGTTAAVQFGSLVLSTGTLQANNILSNGSNANLFTDLGANTLTIGGATGTINIPGIVTVGSLSFVPTFANKTVNVNNGSSTASAALSGLQILGDSNAVVGFMRSGPSGSTNLLQFKAPLGSTLTIDMVSDNTINLGVAATNDVIRYNGTNFTNLPISVSSLSDVSITLPTNGQVLVYNSGSGVWINGNPTGGTLSYVAGSGTAVASGGTSFAAGDNGTASGANSIAIGAGLYGGTATQNTVAGNQSIAIGYFAQANQFAGVAIGYLSTTGSINAGGVALGAGASATGVNSIAISEAQAPGSEAIAIGAGANGSGTNSIAIGISPSASGNNAIAIGGNGTVNTTASGSNSIAIGVTASATQVGAVVVGAGTATGSNSVVLGSGSDGGTANSFVVNGKQTSYGTSGVVPGTYTLGTVTSITVDAYGRITNIT